MVQGMVGNLSDNTNRLPLWERGFSKGNPLYTFIRTLAWYRWWQQLGKEPFTGGAGMWGVVQAGQQLSQPSASMPLAISLPAYLNFSSPALLAAHQQSTLWTATRTSSAAAISWWRC